MQLSRQVLVGLLTAVAVASGGSAAGFDGRSTATVLPVQTPMEAPLGTWTAVHRLLVVPVAGRRLRHVSQEARAFNMDLYGVGTPAAVVRTFRPGGIILFSDNVSSVDQVREFTAGLQRVAGSKGYRLLIMTDQEGGRVSRLPGPVAESQPAAASYDGDAARARRDARLVGAAMRRMHVLVDLAPVADVNTVGDQGVIRDRSFGSTPDVVSRMVQAQVCGYHDGGVATSIKHWPGHGSTRVDSHESLPTLTLPVRRWRGVHLPPFRTGIATGTDLVMVGHLAYPALASNGVPATLSRKLTWRWLRGRLDFHGVIITDSLTMGALRDYGDSARLAVRAFRAGSDLLLMPGRPRAAARGLFDAVRTQRIKRTAVDASVTRVGHLQDKLGLVAGPRQLGSCPPPGRSGSGMAR